MRKILDFSFFFFLIVFSISFASSSLMDVGEGDGAFEGVDIVPPTPPINYTLEVNGSDFFVPYIGATHSVDLGNNDLTVNETTFHVDSGTGRVGIGTDSPDSLLHVEGNTSGAGTEPDGIVHIKQNHVWDANEPWTLYVEGYTYLDGLRIYGQSTARTLYRTLSGRQLDFATNNGVISFTSGGSGTVERMRIDTDGNVGIGNSTPNYKLSVGSTDGSDQVGIYHDNNNAYVKWTDGNLIFQTDEGTDTDTFVEFKGKGDGIGGYRVYDEDDSEYLEFYARNTKGYFNLLGTAPESLNFVHYANVPIQFFSEASAGETQELRIFGYRTGDALRSLQIGVGVDANDTASFDGVSNYYFDGNVGIGTDSPDKMLTIYPNTDNSGLRIYGYDDKIADWGEMRINSGGDTMFQSTGQMQFTSGDYFAMNSAAAIYMDSTNFFIRDTSDVVKMKVDTGTGNVGIGTTSPTHTLNVVGDSNVTENATFEKDVIVGRNLYGVDAKLSGTITASDLNVQGYSEFNFNGLVGHWTADGHARDVSGNDNDGTLYGNTTYSNSISGKAFEFDGDGDYVDVGDPSILQPNGSFSVGVWFKATTQTVNARIFRKRNNGYGLSLLTTGKIYFDFHENSTDSFGMTSPLAYDDGNWHHTIGVYNGSEIFIYIDGSLKDSTTTNELNSVYYAAGGIAIGRDGDSDSNYFNGTIDDVMIFNRSLSATEIQALYKLKKPDGYFEEITTDNNISASNIDLTGNITLGQKITFALGEIIDNIVDGWITITGQLNVTGNITAENVFIPQYIYSHTNETIPIRGANLWTNVTISQEDSDVKQGITHTYNDGTNHTFTIGKDGVYNIDYDFDVEDTSASASDIDVAGRVVYINGSEIKGSVFESDITKQGVEVELSHNFLAELSSGDVIVFQFIATDGDVQISTHGTFGEYPESATILINKIANLL